MKRQDDFVRKTQSICKLFRTTICNITLEQMSNKVNVNMKNLSAWENGRSNKVEYLFYYYDILDEFAKKQFIDAVFNSDGKKIVVDTTSNIDGSVMSYSIRVM